MEGRSDDKSGPENLQETSKDPDQSPSDENIESIQTQTHSHPSTERLDNAPATCEMEETPSLAISEIECNGDDSANQPVKPKTGSEERSEPPSEESVEAEDNTAACTNLPPNSKTAPKQRSEEVPSDQTPQIEDSIDTTVSPNQNSQKGSRDLQQEKKPSREESVQERVEKRTPSSNPPQNSKNQGQDFQQKKTQPSTEEDLIESPDTIQPDPNPPNVQMMEREPEVSNPPSHIPHIPSTNIGVAILVTVCFNLPFGVLAMYFSLMATKAFRDGHPKKGEKKARISVYISLFSIVLTVLIVMAIVLMKAMEGQSGRRRYATKTSVSL